jgi:hypothetical protein
MGLLTNLQRGVLPGIFPLRKLITWFDAVSGRLDASPTFLASASVDAGGTYFGNHTGFDSPISHPSAGVYVLPLSAVADTPNAYAHVTLTAIVGPVTVGYFYDVSFPDTTHVQVRIWKITAGVVSVQDNSFYVSAWVTPAP